MVNFEWQISTYSDNICNSHEPEKTEIQIIYILAATHYHAHRFENLQSLNQKMRTRGTLHRERIRREYVYRKRKMMQWVEGMSTLHKEEKGKVRMAWERSFKNYTRRKENSKWILIAHEILHINIKYVYTVFKFQY